MNGFTYFQSVWATAAKFFLRKKHTKRFQWAEMPKSNALRAPSKPRVQKNQAFACVPLFYGMCSWLSLCFKLCICNHIHNQGRTRHVSRKQARKKDKKMKMMKKEENDENMKWIKEGKYDKDKRRSSNNNRSIRTRHCRRSTVNIKNK